MSEKEPIDEVAAQLGLTCAAPPYWLVHLTRKRGLRRPEDVRWDRLPDGERRANCCRVAIGLSDEVCRAPNGERVELYLAQCGTCGRVVWSLPASARPAAEH